MSAVADVHPVSPRFARLDARRMAALVESLETLQEKFWEYREGWLSEKDFKTALARYSAVLKDLRACLPSGDPR